MTDACALCGCSNPSCLYHCPRTQMCFCNGKSNQKQSHALIAINWLRDSGLNLECTKCGCRNIYALGFLKDSNVIICRDNCLQPNEDFDPLIRNNELNPRLFAIPPAEQCSEVTEEKLKLVHEDFLRKTGKGNLTQLNAKEITECKTKYPSELDYKVTMQRCIMNEKEFSRMKTNRDCFPMINITWTSTKECYFTGVGKLLTVCTAGQSIKITYNDEDEYCVVKVVRYPQIYLEFYGKYRFYQKEYVTISILFMEIPYLRQNRAVSEFSNINDIEKSVFLGDFQNFEERNQMKPIPINHAIKAIPLNDAQKSAVQYAVNHHFSYIQGPPGTGKTTVIAAIVIALLNETNERILVVGQSNVTADNACNILSKYGVKVARSNSITREMAIQNFFNSIDPINDDDPELREILKIHYLKQLRYMKRKTGTNSTKTRKAISKLFTNVN